MKLFCGHCKEEQEVKITSGKHERADCVICGRYVKFVAKPIEEFTLWFGKYRGKTLKEIPKDYLTWLRNNTNNKKLKLKIENFLA